jgi:hypothetical protein
MIKRFWTVESIRNHLLAARQKTAQNLPTALVIDGNGYVGLYRSGGENAIEYLAQRFGLNLDETQPARKSATGELSLRAWDSDQVKEILVESWLVLQPDLPWLNQKDDPKFTIYYLGIVNTLKVLAYSFSLENLPFPEGNGTMRNF